MSEPSGPAARLRLFEAALELENTSLAVLKAPELLIVYANPALKRMTGRTLAGELLRDIAPEVARVVAPRMLEVLETGEPWIENESPWRIRRTPRTEPEQIFLTFDVSPVVIGDEEYLVVSGRDVTEETIRYRTCDELRSELEQAEQKCRRANERYDAVLNLLTDVFSVFDEDLRYVYANDAAVVLAGRPREEILGRTLSEVLPAVEGTALLEETRSALERQRFAQVVDCLEPLGIWIELRAFPFMGGLATILRDVTEQIQGEEALAEANEQFDRVLDLFTDPFAVYDRDWRFVFANEATARMTGVAKEDLLGKTAWELFPEIVGTEVHRRYLEAMDSGRPVLFSEYSDIFAAWYEYRLFPYEDGIATVLRDVTEQVVAEREISERAAFSEALNETDAAIIATMDFDEIVKRAMRGSREALHVDSVVVGVLVGDDRISISHADGAIAMPATSVPIEAVPHAHTALSSLRTVVVQQPERLEVAVEGTRHPAAHSAMVVPLFRGESRLGVMFFNRHSPHQGFTQLQIDFATALGSHVSLALDNARLMERERSARLQAARDAEVSTLLLGASELLTRSLDLYGVGRRLANLVHKTTRRGRVVAAQCDAECSHLHILGGAGAGPLPDNVILKVADLSPSFKTVVTTGSSKVIDYSAPTLSQSAIRRAQENLLELVLVAPIRSGERVVGVVLVDDPGGRTPFSAREIAVVEGIASQAGVAIENARLYQAVHGAALFSQALNDIDADINSTLEFDQIMERIIDRAAAVLDAETASVMLLEDDDWVVRQEHGFTSEYLGMRFPRGSLPIAELAFETRTLVAIDDAVNDPRMNRDVALDHEISGLIAIPLQRHGTVLGALFFNRTGQPRAFTAEEIDFATKLGAHVSLALQNAQLYETERRIADTLQESLLVLPEHVEGISFAHEYLSATEAARVGGDFYDVFAVDHDKIGIVVGDVSGKGLQAAVLTSLARNAIRAHATEMMSPAEAMERAGSIVLATSPAETFFSAFFGIIDLDADRILYCNAGHPSPLLKRSDGSVEQLKPTAPIAGAFKGVPFEMGGIALLPGDSLFLYTDGLTEARHGKELFGDGRLVDVITATGTEDPQETIGTVLAAVRRFTGGRLSDDLALLAIRML